MVSADSSLAKNSIEMENLERAKRHCMASRWHLDDISKTKRPVIVLQRGMPHYVKHNIDITIRMTLDILRVVSFTVQLQTPDNQLGKGLGSFRLKQ